MQVFDCVVPVLDGQFWIASDADDIGPDMFAAFVGQQNGLLGAAEEGQLRLITGKADGDVGFAVQVVESEPELDDSWEDCVEVSFSPRTPVVGFFDWDFNVVFEIPLGAQTYRVRYAGRAMDAGQAGPEMDTSARLRCRFAHLGQCSGMTAERTALRAADFSVSTFPQQKPRRDSDHQDDKSQGNESKPAVRHALYLLRSERRVRQGMV